jgi:hypothetical protein
MPSAEYMREYRARGLDTSRSRTRKSSSNIVRVVRPSNDVPAAAQDEYQYMRHELRDGSGLMWPERVKDSETPYSDANAEIDAAERRRHD